MYRKLSTK